MKKILVTGGTGYIGAHVVVELIAEGFEPVIVDNLFNSSLAKLDAIEAITGTKPTFYNADVGDLHALRDIFKLEKVDGIIHFAAYKAVGESVEEPLMYYENNVSNFVLLLKVAKEYGIRHFVFSSSAAVYGNPETDVVNEDTPTSPTSPYGQTKLMDEYILRDTCAAVPGLHGTALRYFNVVGAHESGWLGEAPNGRPSNLLPIMVQAASGQIPPFTVYGSDYPTSDGTCLRDYIHVVDLAKAHVAAMRVMESADELAAGSGIEAATGSTAVTTGNYNVYNISTGKPTSVLELISAFQRVNEVTVPYTVGERRPGDPVAYYATALRARDELGWQATKTIDDAVRDAWASYQATLYLGDAPTSRDRKS